MKNKLSVNQSIIRTFLFFSIFMAAGFRSSEATFRDVTPEVRRAATSFSGDGMLDSFIFKFGQDLFRPDATVSRADLILVLSEYNLLTERVMEQNRRALARINTLERGSAEPDMDTIIREFQRVLDPMLQNSATIRELREGRAPAMGTSAVSSASSTDIAELQREVATLQRELDSQRRGLEQIARARVSRGKDEGVATTSLNERELRSEIAALRRDIERQQRASSHRPKPTLASGDGEGGFPFWARVSLGLSSMSLFLISR